MLLFGNRRAGTPYLGMSAFITPPNLAHTNGKSHTAINVYGGALHNPDKIWRGSRLLLTVFLIIAAFAQGDRAAVQGKLRDRFPGSCSKILAMTFFSYHCSVGIAA
jgi:hypothetical protein